MLASRACVPSRSGRFARFRISFGCLHFSLYGLRMRRNYLLLRTFFLCARFLRPAFWRCYSQPHRVEEHDQGFLNLDVSASWHKSV